MSIRIMTALCFALTAAALLISPAGVRGQETSTSQTFIYLPMVNSSGGPAQVASPLEERVVELTNIERAKHGCGPLSISDKLTQAARGHSQDMASHNYFSHESLDGTTPWDRIKATGYRYTKAAENIAAGQQTAESVVEGWMQSEGHRKNLLNCALQEIGVGHGYGEGSDLGHYWTQNFATPMP